MDLTHEQFGLLSFVVNIIGNVLYAIYAWRRSAQPNFSVWLIWGLLDAFRVYVMLMGGEDPWQMAGSTLAIAGILAVAWYRKALAPWSMIEWLVFSGVVAFMVATYYLYGTYEAMLIASLAAVTAGSLIMYVKTIKNPYSEPLIPWMICFLATIFQLLATKKMTLLGLAQPVWFIVLMGTLIITIIIRRTQVAKPEVLGAVGH